MVTKIGFDTAENGPIKKSLLGPGVIFLILDARAALGPGLVDPARGFTLSKFQAAVWRSARAVAEAYGGGWE